MKVGKEFELREKMQADEALALDRAIAELNKVLLQYE